MVQTASDPGLAAVQRLAERLQVAAHRCDWSADGRAFTWWPRGHAQTVLTGSEVADGGIAGCRVAILTDFARVVLADEQPAELPEGAVRLLLRETRQASLAGGPILTQDEEGRDLFRLAAQAFVTDENLPWLTGLLTVSALLQPYLATHRGPFPDGSGLELAAVGRGAEEDGSDPVGVYVAQSLLPEGSRPSAWAGREELEHLVAQLNHDSGLEVKADAGSLSAAIPLPGGRSALLMASTSDPHPHLGSGLLMRLYTSRPVGESEELTLPFRLNMAEMLEPVPLYLLGSWTVAHPPRSRLGWVPVHVSFVPNVAYRRGLAANLVLAMIARAREGFELRV